MEIFNSSKTFIIAEIGLNHNGSVQLAEKSIIEASKSGADAVKFQTFKTEDFLSKNFDIKERKKYELTNNEFKHLFEVAKKLKLKFFSTPFDLDSVDILSDIGVELFKISSGDINNWPLIKKIISKQKPVIFSTGCSNIDEINATYNLFKKEKINQLGILHCVSSYPTEISDMNLENIKMLKSLFNDVTVGISDHTQNISVIPSISYSFGARIFEKHFTIDNSLEGYDHKMSLNPIDFSKMVSSIKDSSDAIGESRIKTGTLNSELSKKISARRSIYLKNSKKIGEIILEEDLIALRPGDGISVNLWDKVIGKTVKLDLKHGDKLMWDNITE